MKKQRADLSVKSLTSFRDGLTSKVKNGAQAVATGVQTLGSSAASKADAIAKSEAMGNLKDGVEKSAVLASDSIRHVAGQAAKAAAAFSWQFKK